MARLGEELSANIAYPVGELLFRRLGASTYKSLFDAHILKRTPEFSDKHLLKKPDAIIYNSSGDLFAVIEEKADLSTDSKVDHAIGQGLEAAAGLTKLLIITDNASKTVYVNTKAKIDDNQVVAAEAQSLPMLNVKHMQETTEASSDYAMKIQEVVKNAAVSLHEDNNRLSAPAVLDPTSLARTMWQKIFVSTGKEPEKCLYNVVELFIFKLLSDLGILRDPEDFSAVYRLTKQKSIDDKSSALRYYAQMCRPRIKKLFPASSGDGTTLINGVIFVDETGKANGSHAVLFNELVQAMHGYGEENGSFQHIHAEFKTRLFESFLRQSISAKKLGQFFTPRNVVQSIVRICEVDKLSAGQRLLDPFCGVGGFVLEAIAESDNLRREFVPKDGKIAPRIVVEGWDRGSDEKDEQRTIILAKANMLIYLSDIIADRHDERTLKSFAEHGLNETFKLIKEPGGTFSKPPEPVYDVILTNPPYVTSGSATLKEQLEEFQPILPGRGTEALALEWIVRSLKPGARAFVVVPDGLLRQHQFMVAVARLVRFDIIAKLPPHTFYSTPKVTYIIGVTKKHNPDADAPRQQEAVLGFIVREIGETRDTHRWHTVSDLPILESSFRLFSAASVTEKDIKAISNGLGKMLSFADILARQSFNVDETFWSFKEKQELGVQEAPKAGTSAEFVQGLKGLRALVDDFLDAYPDMFDAGRVKAKKYRSVSIGDERYFSDFKIGKSVDFATLHGSSGPIPVFSSSMRAEPAGYISDDIADKEAVPVFSECVKWNINGSVGNPAYVKTPFSVTADVGVFKVKEPRLNPEFVALQLSGQFTGFCWSNKAGIGKVKKMFIDIPIDENGDFDCAAQSLKAQEARLRREAKAAVGQRIKRLPVVEAKAAEGFERTQQIFLGDKQYFRQIVVKLGWDLKKFKDNESVSRDALPVYTAAKEAVRRVDRSVVPGEKIIRADESSQVFSFASDGDGSAGRNFVRHQEDFVVQANRIVIQIVDKNLVMPYVLAQLASMRQEYGFNRARKANWNNVKKIPIIVPVSKDAAALDTRGQYEWVGKYDRVQKMNNSLHQWVMKYV